MNELLTIQCGPDAVHAYAATLNGPAKFQWMLEVELHNIRNEMRSLEDQMTHIRETIKYLKARTP